MKETKGVYIPCAHFYQPQRRLYHSEFVDFNTDPKGINWTEIINDKCYSQLASKGLFGSELSYDIFGILRMQLQEIDAKTASTIRRGSKDRKIGDPFIHPILPHLNNDDKRIVIGSGLRALEKEGVHPKVFWAPESALDEKTLEVLIDFGYKAILLDPKQLKQEDGSPSDNKFTRLLLKSGSEIIAIPYDRNVSNKLAFGDLSNADAFTRTHILPSLSTTPSGILVTQVDGETFGGHKKFADQFLEYLLKISLGNHDVNQLPINKLLSILEKNKLAKGKLIENSAWSCSHNLSRWSTGCGCTENGSWKNAFYDVHSRLNQKISDIVTESFNGQKGLVEELVVENFEDLLKNPGGNSSSPQTNLLSARVDAICSRQSCSTFFESSSTSGWISIGLSLEAIQHLKDAGLTKEGSRLLDYYLSGLRKVADPKSEAPIQVARRALKDERPQSTIVSLKTGLSRF